MRAYPRRQALTLPIALPSSRSATRTGFFAPVETEGRPCNSTRQEPDPQLSQPGKARGQQKLFRLAWTVKLGQLVLPNPLYDWSGVTAAVSSTTPFRDLVMRVLRRVVCSAQRRVGDDERRRACRWSPQFDGRLWSGSCQSRERSSGNENFRELMSRLSPANSCDRT
jgi:hypothetical protein